MTVLDQPPSLPVAGFASEARFPRERAIHAAPERAVSHRSGAFWRIGSALLLLITLFITPPVVADDDEITDAAFRIAKAAKEVEKTTEEIVKATKAIKDNLEHATDQRVVDGNLDPALTGVKKAVEENQVGLDKVKEAEDLLEEARSLANAGNKSEAAQKAKDADERAVDAIAEAEAAKAKALAAKGLADRAKQTSDNAKKDPPEQPVKPGDEKRIEDGARKEERKAKDQEEEASVIEPKHNEIEEEEEARASSQHEKEDIRLAGEIPLRIGFPLSFFDVFVDLEVTSFPNLDSPLALPTVGGFNGELAELRLLLINENPFPIGITDVEGLLFGDAISFMPPLVDQLILPMDSLSVLLGTVAFIGPPKSFTAADFSIITGADHPGLGPDFAADFQVVAEPTTISLMGFAMLMIGFVAQRKKMRRLFQRRVVAWA